MNLKSSHPMSWARETELRLEGYIVAQTTLRHRCWRCFVPFMLCRDQRERSERLDQINEKLWGMSE